MPARLWRVLAAVTLGCTAVLFTGHRADAEQVLYPCAGAPVDEPAGGLYPQQRQFVDPQTWWAPDGGVAEHEHTGLCLPDRETLDAAVTPSFDAWVRVVMHNNPGYVTYVSMVFKGTDYETTVQKVYVNGLSCPAGTCQQWLRFSAPLSQFLHTGLQEVRFRAFVPQPGGKEQRDNLNFQVYVAGTGRSLAGVTRQPDLRGKGWYSSPSGYCEATLVGGGIPDGPVSGTWSPTVKMDTHSSDASLPVTHYSARVDADFHADPPQPGLVLADADGRWPAALLSVDTTVLGNGPHRLALRSDCHDATNGGTNSGVLTLPFIVQN